MDNSCSGAWVSTGLAKSKTLSSLQPNQTYYWQVRAVIPMALPMLMVEHGGRLEHTLDDFLPKVRAMNVT